MFRPTIQNHGRRLRRGRPAIHTCKPPKAYRPARSKDFLRNIAIMHWNGMSFAELGEYLGVSRQRAHQIYDQALRTIVEGITEESHAG